MSTTPTQPALSAAQIADERRRGRRAGAAGVGAVACAIASIALDGRATHRARGGDDLVRQLRSVHADLAPHVLALGVRVAGLVLTAWFGLYLTRAVRDRAPDAPRALRALAVAAPAGAAAVLAAGLAAMHHVAGGLAPGATASAAHALVRHDAGMRVIALLEMGVHVLTGVWVSLLCLAAVRVGLLSRFLAVWGIGAGLAGVLMPVGDSLLLSWVGSAAVLALGWWPDGRPAAWDAGCAIPWSQVDAERAREWRAPVPDDR